MTVEQLEEAAKRLQEAGLEQRVDYSFVLGFPWEGYDEVIETVRFAGHLHAAYGVNVLLQWYYQLPGSRIWDEVELNESTYPTRSLGSLPGH